MLFTGCILQHKSNQLDKELKSVKQEVEEMLYKCQKTDEEYDSLVCVYTYLYIACMQVLTCMYIQIHVYVCLYICLLLVYTHTYIHTVIQQNFGYPNPWNKMSEKHSDKKMQHITHYSYVEYSTLHIHVQVFSRMTEVTFHIIECTNNWGLDNRACTVCINMCMYICVCMLMYVHICAHNT